MPQDRMQLIADSSQFYRNNYRRLIKFSFILIGVMFLLLGTLFYQYMTRPSVNYFVTTTDGRLVEIFPK